MIVKSQSQAFSNYLNSSSKPNELIITDESKDTVMSLAQAKTLLRAKGENDDDYIIELVRSITNVIEESAEIAIVSKTYKALYRNVREAIQLNFPPIVSITSVKIDGVLTTDYVLKGISSQFLVFNSELIPQDNFVSNEVEVIYTAGYDCGSYPNKWVSAIKSELKFQYANSEASNSFLNWLDTLKKTPTFSAPALYSI